MPISMTILRRQSLSRRLSTSGRLESLPSFQHGRRVGRPLQRTSPRASRARSVQSRSRRTTTSRSLVHRMDPCTPGLTSHPCPCLVPSRVEILWTKELRAAGSVESPETFDQADHPKLASGPCRITTPVLLTWLLPTPVPCFSDLI